MAPEKAEDRYPSSSGQFPERLPPNLKSYELVSFWGQSTIEAGSSLQLGIELETKAE